LIEVICVDGVRIYLGVGVGGTQSS
jgi:hypothetical protein